MYGSTFRVAFPTQQVSPPSRVRKNFPWNGSNMEERDYSLPLNSPEIESPAPLANGPASDVQPLDIQATPDEGQSSIQTNHATYWYPISQEARRRLPSFLSARQAPVPPEISLENFLFPSRIRPPRVLPLLSPEDLGRPPISSPALQAPVMPLLSPEGRSLPPRIPPTPQAPALPSPPPMLPSACQPVLEPVPQPESPGAVENPDQGHSRSNSKASNSCTESTRDSPTMDASEPRPLLYPETIRRNRANQRIDCEDKCSDKNINRIKKLKLCNFYYLLGPSKCKGDRCDKNHTFELKPEEYKILRRVARMAPCKNGTTCRNHSCIYGHNCSGGPKPGRGKHGPNCSWENCKFPKEMHVADRRIGTEIEPPQGAHEKVASHEAKPLTTGSMAPGPATRNRNSCAE